MNNSNDDLPRDFPFEASSPGARADVDGRRGMRGRRPSLVVMALVVLLAAGGSAAVLGRDEGGRIVTTGAGSSPSEEKIAFVRSRGPEDPAPTLYIMNADGTGQMPVRELAALDRLTWSPDGTRLAFNDRDGVAVMNSDGTEVKRLTTVGQWPSWSPDGTRIAYRRFESGTSGIWSMNADGSAQKQLSTGPFEGHPAWSPDGARIAYGGGGPDGDGGISILTVDGSAKTQVLRQDGWRDEPAWSPDGTMIAFRHNSDISVVNADGSQPPKAIATPPPTAVVTPPGGGSPASPSWSPDGTMIAYGLYASSDHCSIWKMSSEGTGQTQLTDGKFCDRDPAWRPRPTAPTTLVPPTAQPPTTVPPTTLPPTTVPPTTASPTSAPSTTAPSTTAPPTTVPTTTAPPTTSSAATSTTALTTGP